MKSATSSPKGGIRNPDKILVYGHHAIESVIKRYPELVTSISIAEEKLKPFRDAHASFFSKTRTPLHPVRVHDLDSYTGGAAHQGIVLTLNQFPYASLDSVLEPRNARDLLVMCDRIQDPHNVGAIARNALAFGARGILIPEHHQAPITSASIKASVGALFEIPVVRVGNNNQTIEKLKKAGWWIAGLATDGKDIREYVHDTPLVVVVGSEGDGMSHGVTTKCDFILSVPHSKGLESLNASVATGIALWELTRTIELS